MISKSENFDQKSVLKLQNHQIFLQNRKICVTRLPSKPRNLTPCANRLSPSSFQTTGSWNKNNLKSKSIKLHWNFVFLSSQSMFSTKFLIFCQGLKSPLTSTNGPYSTKKILYWLKSWRKKEMKFDQNFMFKALLKPILTILFHFSCSRSSNLSSGRRMRSTSPICVAKEMTNGTSLTIVYERFNPFEAFFIQFLKISFQFQSNFFH